MTTLPIGKKVLLVEDDEATLKALHEVLANAGLVIIEAKNGALGLEAAYQEHPDLILLDILMPTMDGWQMLQALREKDSWGKCVPVVILTNLSSDEDTQIRHIAELGPSFFMVKSDWKAEGIVNKVLEMLSAEQITCP
jgi:CheY-like chemotaxis protein